jgi:hypothetical protein
MHCLTPISRASVGPCSHCRIFPFGPGSSDDPGNRRLFPRGGVAPEAAARPLAPRRLTRPAPGRMVGRAGAAGAFRAGRRPDAGPAGSVIGAMVALARGGSHERARDRPDSRDRRAHDSCGRGSARVRRGPGDTGKRSVAGMPLTPPIVESGCGRFLPRARRTAPPPAPRV